MSQVFTFVVDGVEMPCPSEASFGIQDISSAESGRDSSGTMHKNRVTQKIKFHVKYAYPTPDIVQRVLTAVNPEYVNVTIYNPMLGRNVTYEMYCSDRDAPYKFWWIGNKRFEKLEFDLIER